MVSGVVGHGWLVPRACVRCRAVSCDDDDDDDDMMRPAPVPILDRTKPGRTVGRPSHSHHSSTPPPCPSTPTPYTIHNSLAKTMAAVTPMKPKNGAEAGHFSICTVASAMATAAAAAACGSGGLCCACVCVWLVLLLVT